MPPPAYRPQPAPVTAPAETFVAPQSGPAMAPGVSERLKAAVASPGITGRAAPAPAEEPRQRTGIGSLIDRMVGHSTEDLKPQRPEPQVRNFQSPQEQVDPEEEKIEIPAFLRRQAN